MENRRTVDDDPLQHFDFSDSDYRSSRGLGGVESNATDESSGLGTVDDAAFGIPAVERYLSTAEPQLDSTQSYLNSTAFDSGALYSTGTSFARTDLAAALKWDNGQTTSQFQSREHYQPSQEILNSLHPGSRRVLPAAHKVVKINENLFLVRHKKTGGIQKLVMKKCASPDCLLNVIATAPCMGIKVGDVEPHGQPYKPTQVKEGKCPDCVERYSIKRMWQDSFG